MKINSIVKRAIIGGVISSIFMATGTYIFGAVSGCEAKVLLSSSLSGINMLCNTVILGACTTTSIDAYLIKFKQGCRIKSHKNSL